MWKLWQVVILLISFGMWIGWTLWNSKSNKNLNEGQDKDKQKEKNDDSWEIEVIFMINAVNFILILFIMD